MCRLYEVGRLKDEDDQDQEEEEEEDLEDDDDEDGDDDDGEDDSDDAESKDYLFCSSVLRCGPCTIINCTLLSDISFICWHFASQTL